METMYEQFFAAMNNIAQRNIDSTAIDLTIDAEVRAITNVEVGQYKVMYQDNIFDGFALDPTVVYKVGEKVYVLVPQGDFSSKKIILGRSKYQNATSYAERQAAINFYKTHGPNWLEKWYSMDHTPLGIVAAPHNNITNINHGPANWKDYGFLRYLPNSNPNRPDDPPLDRAYIRYPGAPPMTPADLAYQEVEFRRYAKVYEYVLIKADFHTQFASVHDIGEYSLQVQCISTNPLYLQPDHPAYDPNEPEYRLVTFELGFKDFIGAPYAYAAFTPNSAAFKVPLGQLKGLYSVALHQNGNFVVDMLTTLYDIDGNPIPSLPNYQDNNIQVQNVTIHFAEKINLTDSLYWTKIEFPIGDSLSAAHPQVEVVGKLYYGYFTELTDPTNCTFKWYRRAADSMEGLPNKYDKLAGPGWLPIDPNLLNGTMYGIDFNRLTVDITAVPWKWRYKMVVVYGAKDDTGAQRQEVICSEEFEIDNRDSIYDLQLKQYVDDNNSNTMLQILNIPDLDPITNQPKAEWLGDWYRLLADQSYTMLPPQPVTSLRQRGPYRVTELLDYDAVTVLVNCFDPYLTNENNYIGVLEHTFLTPNERDFYVEWIGKDTFGYDANGSVKWEAAVKDNTLYANFQWLEGFATDCLVDFLAPDGTYLKNWTEFAQDPISGGSGGYNIEDSMLRDMWIDGNKTIHFKVKEKYDKNKENNRFIMRVYTVSTDEYYDVFKEIFFTKDGDQGTQGADWMAPIWPTNHRAVDGTLRYTYPLDYPCPIVIQDGTFAQIIDGGGENGRYRLLIRPFVTKNGERVEDMNPTEGYTYKVYWDVRYPQNMLMQNGARLVGSGGEFANGPANSSFLRLYDRNGGMLTPAGSGFNVGRTFPVGVQNFQGYTQYSGVAGGTDDTVVEVRFQVPYAGLSFDDVRYNFYVKAQIDIYQGDWDPENQIHKEDQLVASIQSVYPVDILVRASGMDFEPRNIATNWPQYVDYNATGYQPQVMADPLYFKYGELAANPIANITSYPPHNLTPDIQTLEHRTRYGDGMAHEKVDYYYRPKTYFFYQDGYQGAISTQPSNSPFGRGDRYIRNQVFRLNNFGNADVNAWDGQGVDINEEKGTLFAPTVGAGYKDPYTNTFTGVIMGVDKSQLRMGRDEGNVGNRQGYSPNSVDQKKYMTGLYGYQEGFASFGIMENGTAFFGRADRGGRIIIDGYNATMYGGGNGTLGDPVIGDPMWNTMRLTFVDLTHSTNNGNVLDPQTYYNENDPENVAATEVDGVKQGFDGHYFGEGQESTSAPTFQWSQRNDTSMPWWYRYVWENAYLTSSGNGSVMAYPKTASDQEYGNTADKQGNPWTSVDYYSRSSATSNNGGGRVLPDGNTTYTPDMFYVDNGTVYVNTAVPGHGLTGFGPGRASTTPAIEIGQHIDGLAPSPLPWRYSYQALKDIEIPGHRNFMVTYDGTMWAMNGVFRGNVIASNIIGGSIYGAEIGIGDDLSEYATYDDLRITAADDYKTLRAPVEEPYVDSTGETAPKAFYVDFDGNVTAKSIRIYGGEINVGHFHVIGADASGEYGDIIQFGHSDFVGPVHMYGSLGIGPIRSGGNAQYTAAASQWGNLYHTRGQVGLGILAPESQFGEYHGILTNPMQTAVPYKTGLQKIAFFGIDNTAGKNDVSGITNTVPIKGHFWPMFYNIGTPKKEDMSDGTKVTTNSAWFTTMDNFAAPQLDGVIGADDGDAYNCPNGGNYFRVGPYGNEFGILWCRTAFQPEAESKAPDRKNSYGWFGPINGSDPIGARNDLGMVAWGDHTLIVSSEKNIGIKATGAQYIESGFQDATPTENAPGQAEPMARIYLPGVEYEANLPYTTMISVNAMVLGVVKCPSNDDFIYNGEFNTKDWQGWDGAKNYIASGLTLTAGKGEIKPDNVTLFNKVSEICIVRGNRDNIKESVELRLSDKAMRLTALEGISLTCGKSKGTGQTEGEGWEAHKVPEVNTIGVDGATASISHEILSKVIAGGPNGEFPNLSGVMGVLFSTEEGAATFGNGQGKIDGINDTIDFTGAWAEPEKQLHIYARYAG